MKRLIALLAVAAFGISILANPVSSVCPDPKDARFIRGDTPYGDDGGWGEPVENSNNMHESFPFYRLNFTYPLVKFLFIRVIDNSESQDNNDTESLKELNNNRRSNSE
jgi:hypothetical protein